MAIDANKKYTATFNTSRGEIVCELFAKDKPKTVNNFVFLAREKFYDNTTFHRVIADFMIQGGDPQGTGRGGPGYRFEDEIEGKTNGTRWVRCRWPMPGRTPTAASFSSPTWSPDYLDPKHTVFGQVRRVRMWWMRLSRATSW